MTDEGAPGASLRITLSVANYAPSVGGAQEYFRQVAEGLARRGHDVEVLTTDALRAPGRRDAGHITATAEDLAGVRVQRFHQPSWGGAVSRALSRVAAVIAHRDPAARRLAPATLGPLSPTLALATWRACRRRDVVIGGPAPFTTLTVPVWARSRCGAEVALVPFLHVSLSQPHRAVRRALRRARLVAAATDFEREVLEGLGVAPGSTAVLPPGVDLEEYPALDPAEARNRLGLPDRPTVGYVGRLAVYKGVDTLLAAAPLLWDEFGDLTLLVAGSSAGWTGHREAAEAQLGGDRLVIREDFDQADRAALLAACDVIVCPSREESFGMVIVEAWAARRPVVAADIEAVRSTVERCPGGLLFAVDDVDGLAAAVGDLVRDPARAAAAGEAGRHFVEAEFGWPAIVDGWESRLRRLVADP